MKLDITYCHRCSCTHDLGKHVQRRMDNQASSGAPVHRPAPVIVPDPPAPVSDAPEPSPGWNKNRYQANYMADRREADKMGFAMDGQNPKTVKQYRVWRSEQAQQQKVG